MSNIDVLALAEQTANPVLQMGIRRHDFVRVRFLEALEPLTDEQIHWWPSNARPGDTEARPIALLLEHVGGSAVHYLSRIVGEPAASGGVQWHPPHADSSAQRTVAFYRAEVLKAYDRLIQAVLQASPEVLQREAMVRSGRSITGEGLLFHAAEHLYYHTGQINYVTMLPGFPGR
jgi:uncharacterized damage-inducible protein DinB